MPHAQKLALATALVVCAGMWLYVDRVLIANQQTEAAARDIPRGNLSDLYPSWLASRELLLHRRDPYTAEITREIQIGYYGRPIDPSRPNDPKNQQAFAYPVYVAFFLAPTVKMPFAEVQVLFRSLLAGLTAVSLFFWLGALGWRQSWISAMILALFFFGSFPVVQGIKLQQLSLLVAALIAACIYCLVKGWHVPAGILLALATIKPQLTVPLAAWLMLWSFSLFKMRWKLAAAFAASIAALVGAGELLLPGWLGKFYGALLEYRKYAVSSSLLGELTTPVMGVGLTIAILIVTAIICWNRRHTQAPSTEFFSTTSLVLAVTVVIIPTIAPYNQPLLIPGAFIVLIYWRAEHLSNQLLLLRSNLLTRVFRGVTAACLVWHWISAVGLAAASFFTTRAQDFWRLPLWTSVLMPVALSVCLMLVICFPAMPHGALAEANRVSDAEPSSS